MLFSLGTLPSMMLGWVQADGTADVFGQAFAATATSGVILWLLTQSADYELKIRDGFLVTAAFWIVLGLYGSLPFLLTETIDVSTLTLCSNLSLALLQRAPQCSQAWMHCPNPYFFIVSYFNG